MKYKKEIDSLEILNIEIQIKNLGYEIISVLKIHKHKKKLILKDIEGYLFTCSLYNLQRGKRPSKFGNNNPYTIQNIKLWCKLNNKPFELISETFKNSTYDNLKWKCLNKNCGEEFYATWDSIRGDHGCGVCDGRQVGLSNCLATKNPELAFEWHPTKNGDLTPYDVTANSGKEVWWQCSKGHKWKAIICNRSKEKGTGCPYCSGRYPTEEYNLLISNPILCKNWNYKKNNKCPEEYLPNSRERVWWECNKCGYEWEADICDINKTIDKEIKCPNCTNLLAINPVLCEEWDYNKNNKNPEDYYPSSKEYAWWKCKECGYEWIAKINNRNTKDGHIKTGCPKCNDPKGEKRCNEFLNIINLPHDRQYTFNNLRGLGGGLLRFDISVFYDEEKTKLRLLIEYDGIFHYEKQYDDDGFEKLQIHDKLKNNYCIKNNIILVRIPYWESNNIENILEDILIHNNLKNKFVINNVKPND